ncbi:MAG: S9 family peptidase [Sphingosinicella sp.]|nr:S9 family peptidase [Sphingosinicella sp.]
MATDISAAEIPAFAWVMRQGENTSLMFAKAPEFKLVNLFSQPDVDGQPITSVAISPDGNFVAFQTGAPFGGGGEAFNPASLIETPKVTLWLVTTSGVVAPIKIGAASGASFSPDSKRMIFREGKDLWSVDPADPAAKPRMLVAGGGGLGRTIWTKDGKTLIFVQDRGGWAFLGRYTPGEDRVHWLVTGADRLSSPALSPDGKLVAYLRWPGRTHTASYDQTESEPFAVETVDLATGQIQLLHQAIGKAGLQSTDDPEGHLRWADDRSIVFRSEQDGWARLYKIGRSGGVPRALTPAGCEIAESELTGPDTLFVIHNCRDLDTRQLSRIVVSTGEERPLPSNDVVMGLAGAMGNGRYVAFTGSDAEAAPLPRVIDLQSGKYSFAQKPADYGYGRGFNAPAPRVIRLTASDGGTVPAQLFLPAGKGPHPALVYVHGGPQRQMFPAFHFSGYYANDFAVNRHLAELGYLVVSINYRSGVGYGRAFREAPGRAWRGATEYNDVLGVGRWLAARPDVDPERIGIWGGSYGGLLTGLALARNSDLFAAGVAVHGVYDWSWPSPLPGHLSPSEYFGVGEADKSLAFRSSTLGAIDGWRSPVLLFTGDRDMNVDARETVDLHQKLRAKGVDVRSVLVPGEAHDMIRHSSWLQLWDESRRFFQEKLGR